MRQFKLLKSAFLKKRGLDAALGSTVLYCLLDKGKDLGCYLQTHE